MARKTKEEAARTRERILAEALSEFCERGYSRATLEGIAERAGFTRGAVYWHFKSKAEIFAALASEMHARSETHLNVDWSRTPDSLDEVASSFTNYLVYFEEDEDFRRFYEMAYFNTEWTEELSEVLEAFDSYQGQSIEWTEQALLSLQGRGLANASTDMRVAALALTCLVDGLLANGLSKRRSFSLANEGRFVIDLFVERLTPLRDSEVQNNE